MLFSLNQLLEQLGLEPLQSDYLVNSNTGFGIIVGLGMILGVFRVFGGLVGNSILLGRAFVSGDGTDAVRAIKEMRRGGVKEGGTEAMVAPLSFYQIMVRVLRCILAAFLAVLAFGYFWLALSCPDTGVWAIRSFVLGTFLGWTLMWGWGYRSGNLDLDQLNDRLDTEAEGEKKV